LGLDMQELVNVKVEEGAVLEGEIRRREEVLGRVKGWEMMISQARKQLSSYAAKSIGTGNGRDNVGANEEDTELQELKNEHKSVGNEISELEIRLSQLRLRQSHLAARIASSENRREARLSSYRGALRDVESDVAAFLKNPPLRDVSVVMHGEKGFLELPVGRRTLEMAGEWWGREVEALVARQEEVRKEKEALEAGLTSWGEVVSIVGDFEDGLRRDMAEGASQTTAGLRSQITKMQEVISQLEAHFATAEQKRWNLLICAVGAELEAFREGSTILQAALGTPPQDRAEDAQNEHHAAEQKREDPELEKEDSFHSTDDGLTLAELNGAVSKGQESGAESEDDGPDLASLLVDRGGHGHGDDID